MCHNFVFKVFHIEQKLVICKSSAYRSLQFYKTIFIFSYGFTENVTDKNIKVYKTKKHVRDRTISCILSLGRGIPVPLDILLKDIHWKYVASSRLASYNHTLHHWLFPVSQIITLSFPTLTINLFSVIHEHNDKLSKTFAASFRHKIFIVLKKLTKHIA